MRAALARPIGLGIVGTGFGHKIHLPGFTALREEFNLQVLALLGNDPKKTARLAAEYDIPHACTSLAELLAIPQLQAVSIATPPYLHFPQAIDVLTAGKHLLCEKPTALDTEQARQMLATAEARNLVHVVDFEFRCVPHWQYLHELLMEGAVGPLRLITVDWLVEGRADAQRPWNWNSERDRGGGALGALGSHVFDYLGWLFGPVTRLNASLNTLVRTRPDPDGEWLPVDSDDTCRLWLQLSDDTPVDVCISTVTWQGTGHRMVVYGERGTLMLTSENQRDYVHGFRLLQADAGEGEWRELDVPPALQFTRTYPDGRLAPFIEIARRFLTAIQDQDRATPSLYEGVYSQFLMDLARQSHQQQTWVEVPTTEYPMRA